MKPHRVSQIWREHRESGGLNELIGICSFLDAHTFLTKSGDLGVVLRVRGIDYECLDPQEVDGLARRFEAALRSLGEEFRLYQYLLKRTDPEIPFREYENAPIVNRAVQGRMEFLREKAADLYSIELYFVILYEGWQQADQ